MLFRSIEKIINYNWPGNVRELKNTIEKSMLLASGPTLKLQDIPPEITHFVKNSNGFSYKGEIEILKEYENLPFKEAKKCYVREFEKQFIIKRLKIFKGNVSQTAQSLDIPRQSLQQKLKELSINPRDWTQRIVNSPNESD